MKKQKIFKVNLGKKIAPIIGSRDVIQELDKLIKKAKSNLVELDFINVDFISRAFADELINLRKRMKNKNVILKFINTNNEANDMLRIVSTQKASKKIKKIDLPVKDLEAIANQF